MRFEQIESWKLRLRSLKEKEDARFQLLMLEGKRAFEAGTILGDCPYERGMERGGWCLGWRRARQASLSLNVTHRQKCFEGQERRGQWERGPLADEMAESEIDKAYRSDIMRRDGTTLKRAIVAKWVQARGPGQGRERKNPWRGRDRMPSETFKQRRGRR